MSELVPDDLWADVLKFVRWSANVREDNVEAIRGARELLYRIEMSTGESSIPQMEPKPPTRIDPTKPEEVQSRWIPRTGR